MISEHEEIEAKFIATDVSVADFIAHVWKNYHVESFLHVMGPDRYYENKENEVVRHRIDKRENRHELTVKKRKSDGSTRDRLEIDLSFGSKTLPKDVDAFLRVIGFSHVFTIIKEAHIFWVKLSPNLTATFVIYDVWKEDEPTSKSRYLETEAEKGSDVTPDTAKRHIRAVVSDFKKAFKLQDPLNQSLWEIYSGRQYLTA